MGIVVHSLSISPTTTTTTIAPTNRRDFLARGGQSAAVISFFHSSFPALADDESDNISSLLDAKTISWDHHHDIPSSSWSRFRYGTSTLLNDENSNTPPVGTPAIYPSWMEGYQAINYKFNKASFPQGRGILSLRTAGAGLGTCLSLPNVGYSPPAPHAMHFIKRRGGGGVYEDLAYTIPRKFESFWPESKVLAVRTNNNGDSNSSALLSPKCFVTGDGCSDDVNPNLHSAASRIAMDFEGPTRRGGRVVQSCDVTMLNHSIQNNVDGSYFTSKSYSQYNAEQELQTFYKEITSWERMKKEGEIVGKIRVAAFLPYYIKEMDANNKSNNNNGGGDVRNQYEEDEAVAFYDYKFTMKSIDQMDAASL